LTSRCATLLDFLFGSLSTGTDDDLTLEKGMTTIQKSRAA